MADIDMIPRSYRDGIRVRRTLRRAALALAIVTVAAIAGSVALRWQIATFERQAAVLRAAATRAQSAQARDATLREAQARRMQQDATLRAVRRQGELAAFAQAIDSALPPDAWLTGIVLRRDLPSAGPAVAIGSGRIEAAPAAQDAPPAATIVELTGQAGSYEAMTAFLAQLGRAPGVAAVQLQSSGAGAGAATGSGSGPGADAGTGAEQAALGFHAVVTLAWRDRP